MKGRNEPLRLTKRQAIDALIVALAILVRVAAVWVLQSPFIARSTYEHGEIAANLVSGRGFSTRFLGAEGPTSQQAPLYPTLVALAYAVAGIETPRALLLVELGQSILGGVLVLGVLRLGRQVAPDDPRMPRIAALIVALHPTLVYAATHVQVATLAATLCCWTMAMAYQCRATRRKRDAAFTGVLLALLTLTDPILALAFFGIAFLLLLDDAHPIRRRVSRLTLIATVALLGISPWLARNFLVHGEVVAIKSTFGYAFWQGNCALSAGTDKVVRESVERVLGSNQKALFSLAGLNRTLWAARHEAGYLDDIALTQADYRMLGRFSEPERSRILFRRALADLAANPARYGTLCLRRARYFFFFDETNPKSRVLAYRVPHLGLTLLAAVGLLTAAPPVRKRLWPTVTITALIAIFHTLTIVSSRFHIPIEPFLAVWGASGVSRWCDFCFARSTAARDDVKRVGIVDDLAFRHAAGDVALAKKTIVHARHLQASHHRADADDCGTSPRNPRHGSRVAD